MIRTDIEKDNDEQEYDGTFVVNADDDTAFFHLDMGNSYTFGNSNQQSGTMGGFVRNEWSERNTTIAGSTRQTTDPSANCNRQCDSCMFSFLCKSSLKGLSSLGGTNFIPKLV